MDIDVLYLKDHDINLIKAKGRLDSYYATQIENSLDPLLRRAKKITLECSDITFLKQCWNKGPPIINEWTQEYSR